MKVLPWVVLVSVASSLATVGAIELLRDRGPRRSARGAIERSVAAPPARSETLAATRPVPVSSRKPAGWEERLVELERRLSAIELAATREPAPTTPASEDLPSRGELRELVLDWVAEDRQARGHVREVEQQDEARAQREFDAQYQAHMFAQEHGLAEWQEKEFAELFLEIGERTAEIEATIDPAVDDPREVEARWLEFDEWVDQREREVTARIDPALYQKIYGED